MLRIVIFLLGCLVMGGALLFAVFPAPSAPARFGWSWWFALGLALAIGAAHWPEGLH
jgi:hypothetical protein